MDLFFLTRKTKEKDVKALGFCLFLLFTGAFVEAECRDFDAMAAANEKANSYFKKSDVFHPAVVQKVHHPSRKKEIASYIKMGKKRYTVFTLVDADCEVKFLKRSRQND